ncbi:MULTISPECIES: GGDEF domain-containing response regulator [unclassified Coleofasciculus]|uniref:EAL domain-containing response regulator n=1 Tax=unclassified Coleofasciculus TaxID=2692782 RepID=UPI001882B584|nr:MULTISPECIES: GGDEF domain-containing response regulator [unclassified Coleofasciculus]MBE9126439.1 EAL domain-containing protein [Coleofasciculus sp. LEGE 07081]MBE9148041.1 EAL domain-containing protein [Coleofasciculus sp. LEGE 07092]
MTKKILVIEDETFVRENILELLDAEGIEGIGAENGNIGIDLAREQKPDLILCDVMMPALDGYGVLTALRQDSALTAIPFIFLTAKAAKADFRQGMELGADDYLTKPFTRAELLGAIATRFKKQAAVQKFYDSELQVAKEQLNYLMHHDSLTGLPNQLSLREQFNQVQTTETQSLIPVLCLGLDRFNQVNNNLGQAFGDLLLQAVAQRLTACVGSKDIVARLNADRFAIILATIHHKKDAIQVAQAILRSFSQTFVVQEQELFVTASIGMALSPRDGADIEQLLARANQAMVQAKQQGGDLYQWYSSVLNTGSSDNLALQTSLRHALERNELEVYYQPQVNLRTGQIMGAEALLRWQHPERGMVSPGKFIPIAEETGLIVPIGEWVLQTACQQTKDWQRAGFSSLRVAVNLSSRQFNQVDLRQRLVKILNQTALQPQYLELELTESMLIKNVEVAIRRLNALKALGVEIAIDDFGTGYSSLSYLQQFPFDVLKIDQCFVRNIMDNSSNAAITQAIIQMAKSLKLKLIAEGVETETELAFVCQHQCDGMQGYLFSRPLSANEFEKLLINRKSLPIPIGANSID